MATPLRLSRQTILEEGPRIRRWVLSGVIAGVPLFFLRFTNDPFNVPKLALLTSGVALVVCIRALELMHGGSFRSLQRLAFPAAAMAIPLVVSWASSPYRYWSLFGHYGRFQGLIPYLVVILLGVLVADAFSDHLRHLAWALCGAGAVAGAYATLQFIGVDPFTWVQQFGGETTRTSTLGNPNFTGGFLAIVLPIAIALWRSEGAGSRHAGKALVAIVAGLVLSFSQGPYAAAVAGGAILAAFSFSRERRWARVTGVITVSVIALVILGAVGFAMARPASEVLPLSTAQRALWWRGALAMAADHPVLGRGPNTYAVEGPRYRPVEDAAIHGLDFSDDTHSVPLAFLTSAGLFGLLGYLIVVAWTFVKGWLIPGRQLLPVAFVAAAIAYFVQGLVSIDEIALRTAFWSALGGLGASLYAPEVTGAKNKVSRTKSRRNVPKRRRDHVRFAVGVPLLVLLTVVSGWWGTLFVVNDARVRWGIAAFRHDEPERAQEEFDRALGFRGEYHYQHLNGFFAGETAVERGESGRRWLDTARDAYAFLQRFPHVPALVDYARLLAAYSEFDPSLRSDAADVYLRITLMDPNNLQLLSEAAEALKAAGRQEALDSVRARIKHVEEKRLQYLR